MLVWLNGPIGIFGESASIQLFYKRQHQHLPALLSIQREAQD
jgi:hypothetical protein